MDIPLLRSVDVPGLSNREDLLPNVPPTNPVPVREGNNLGGSVEDVGVRVIDRVLDMPSVLVRLELPVGVSEDRAVRYFSISYEVDRLPVESLFVVEPVTEYHTT